MSIAYTQKHTQDIYPLGSYREFSVRGLTLGKAEGCSQFLCHIEIPQDHSQYWPVFGTGETGASLLAVFPVLIYTSQGCTVLVLECLALALQHVFNSSFLYTFLAGLHQCQVGVKHR